MKLYEVRLMEEMSDGVWRGAGDPVFTGNEKDALSFVAANSKFPTNIYEVQIATFKKGREVKRQVM